MDFTFAFDELKPVWFNNYVMGYIYDLLNRCLRFSNYLIRDSYILQ